MTYLAVEPVALNIVWFINIKKFYNYTFELLK